MKINFKIKIIFTVLFILMISLLFLLLSNSKNHTNKVKPRIKVSPAYTHDIASENLYTKLYYINTDTSFYYISSDTIINSENPDGKLSGIYTGQASENFEGYLEIDYGEEKVLVSNTSAMEIENTKILPLGTICQLTPYYVGYSGCGPACLKMLVNNISDNNSESIKNYEDLLYYAENNGYDDQGSLLNFNGGMSYESLKRLAKDVFNVNLINKYSADKNPSAVLKELIDNGKQAIVLVHHEKGAIVYNSGSSHFILITGYIEKENELDFVYSNSYYTENILHSNPLMQVSSELLDKSASTDFNEPNAIICIE